MADAALSAVSASRRVPPRVRRDGSLRTSNDPLRRIRPMPDTIRKTAVTVAALGALALGGSALANAATSTNANSNAASGTYAQPPAGQNGQRPDPTKPGGHVGANG